MKLRSVAGGFTALVFAFAASAQSTNPLAAAPQYPSYPRHASETPATFTPTTDWHDYERRIAEIPMRDGVKLHTVILVPKGAHRAGILLTRTHYDAEGLSANSHSGHLATSLEGYDNATDVVVEDG